MIRPSQLAIAKHCQLSPVLAARYPETNANIARGQAVDAQVTAWINEGTSPADPAAADCVRWLERHMSELAAQVECSLVEDDHVITRGTADVVGVDSCDRCLIVVDLKKQEQYYAGKLALPDENLQLHAYAIASVRARALSRYRTALLLFGDRDCTSYWSREYTRVEWTPKLDEIRNICAQESPHGTVDPIGQAGAHCTDCYPRLHCRHWALPAYEGESALAPLLSGDLTPERAGQGALAVKAIREMADRAEEILKAYRRQAGEGSVVAGDKQWGPVIQRGRKSADVAALERDGLHQYLKQGHPVEAWRWTKRR